MLREQVAGKWNAEPPEMAMRPGHSVISINGVRSDTHQGTPSGCPPPTCPRETYFREFYVVRGVFVGRGR